MKIVYKYINKLIRKIKYHYILEEENNYNNIIGNCGKNVKIGYPCIIEHPEMIYVNENTQILPGGRIQAFPEHVSDSSINITIGKNCLLGFRICILAGSSITIGDNCIMASDVTIVSHNHGTNPELELPYRDQKLTVAKVKLGNNVWVGDKVTILAGVVIGDNCVIGAGSVVNRSFPENCMMAGVPARIIKKYDFNQHIWRTSN